MLWGGGCDRAGRGATGLHMPFVRSVSLDPPLITFSVARSSSTWPRIREVAPSTCWCTTTLNSGQFAQSAWTGRTSEDDVHTIG
ncbi:flavin reductase family protein [Nocardioides sp. CF8]|uniref:flavin reductase family protein n=1 Tax=Nocardioides sp. CF8 TaxID=110319 RepID=UPI003FA57111